MRSSCAPKTIFTIRDILQSILPFLNLTVIFDKNGKTVASDFLSLLTCCKAFHFAIIAYPDFHKKFEIIKLSHEIYHWPRTISLQQWLFSSHFIYTYSRDRFRDNDAIRVINKVRSHSVTNEDLLQISEHEKRTIIDFSNLPTSYGKPIARAPAIYALLFSVALIVPTIGCIYVSINRMHQQPKEYWEGWRFDEHGKKTHKIESLFSSPNVSYLICLIAFMFINGITLIAPLFGAVALLVGESYKQVFHDAVRERAEVVTTGFFSKIRQFTDLIDPKSNVVERDTNSIRQR